MTIEDVQALAANLLALPTPKKFQVPKPDANGNLPALYRYWLEHKEVGAPFAYQGKLEIPLADGTAAILLSTGKVLHWTGGDTVEVV
jgi:hypothetical protein